MASPAAPGPSVPSQPTVPPAFIIALAIVGVSWAAILVRWSHVSAYVLAFWRLSLSLLVIATALTAGREWSRLTRVKRGDLYLLGLAGALLAFHFVTWFISLEYTTVASSTLLVNLHPLFAAGLSALWLHERPSGGEWAGIVIATLGAVVVAGASLALGLEAQKGNGLALLGGVLMAGYFVIGRRQRRTLGIWPYVAWVYAIAALILVPFIAARNEPFLGYPARHTGFNWALRHVRAYIVNLAVLGEPIGASLLAWWLLGGREVLGPATVVGGVLILLGVAISIYSRQGVSS
ncbi:MAG: hypothetical protein AMS25_17675 [Gemmatimonas sp. SM23_52]|nr:MAG: hypothetical protein AMS25_17675 [Gemmatimonas sp. SM23_52]